MNVLKEEQLNKNKFYGKKTIISDANLFSSIDYEMYDNKKAKVFASMRNILTQKRQQCKVKKDKKASSCTYLWGIVYFFRVYILHTKYQSDFILLCLFGQINMRIYRL